MPRYKEMLSHSEARISSMYWHFSACGDLHITKRGGPGKLTHIQVQAAIIMFIFKIMILFCSPFVLGTKVPYQSWPQATCPRLWSSRLQERQIFSVPVTAKDVVMDMQKGVHKTAVMSDESVFLLSRFHHGKKFQILLAQE